MAEIISGDNTALFETPLELETAPMLITTDTPETGEPVSLVDYIREAIEEAALTIR